MSESDEEAVVTTATSSSMSGSSAMAVSAVGKQKSLFAGMGRVRHINHLREKWSGKPKSMMTPVRSFDTNSASTSSSTMMALRKTKKLHTSRKAANDSGSETDREPADKRRRRTLSTMDMERFHTLSSWLEQNGIAIPQQSSHRWQHKQPHGVFENVQSPIAKADVFDDVYDALEILEKAVEGEISQLGPSPSSERQASQDTHANKDYREKARESPSLFDYLVVIGPDVTDIAIQNYWHHEENVFEATVAFAWPPQSQFNAESIERFCFPSGISVLQHDQSENADASNAMDGDNFFVLMLSGGGAQGQSVQYASCMKGLVTLPAINHDNVGGLVRVPVCYCLVSEMPFIPFSKNVLTRLLDDHRKDLEFGEEQRSMSSIVSNQHARMIDDALRRLQETPYPSRGCTVVAACFPSFDTELTLSRPREEEGADEKNTLLLQWSLPHLLSVLSIDRILRIVRLLLLEMKVIVVSTKLTLLSSATLGIASLLHPLKWAGPLITILPPFLHEYMEAPVPLICGVEVLPSSYGCTKGTAIIHLESDEIEMHGEDERIFSQANLPGLNELAQNLAGLTKQLKDRSVISAFKTTHFAIDVVIRRVRRQIEHLLAICADLDAHKPFKSVNSNLEEQEFELVRLFMRSQMYQKYRDDYLLTGTVSKEHTACVVQPPVTVSIPQTSMQKQSHGNQVDWKQAASILFRIAMTGVNECVPETEASDSNSVFESEKSTGKDSTIDRVSDAIAKPQSTNSQPVPVRSYSNQSIITICSRRSKLELQSQADSLSGSPANNSQFKLLELLPAATMDELLVPRIQPVYRHASSEMVTGGPDTLKSTSSIYLLDDVDQVDFGDLELNDQDESLVHSNATNQAHASFGIAIDLRRADTETSTLLSGTTDVYDEGAPTDSPEKSYCKSWLSDSSSCDDKESDSNEQDSPRYRSGLNGSTVLSEDDGFTIEDIESAEEKTLKRVSSIQMIQRSWRQWKQRRDSTISSTAFDGASYFMDVRQQGSQREHSDASFLTAGVRVLKDSGLGEPQQGEYAVVELHCHDKRNCFKYEVSADCIRFFSALFGLVSSIAILREDSTSVASYQTQPREVEVESLVKPSASDFESSSYRRFDIRDSLSDQSYIERFKMRLQEGFLVEKHGRIGKPHMRMLFTDILCSRIMWKKPTSQSISTAEHQRMSSQAGRRQPSNAFFQKCLLVADITAVVEGKQTRVFKRFVAKASDDNQCISIVTPKRTLDIRALALEDFNILFRGLSQLVQESSCTQDYPS